MLNQETDFKYEIICIDDGSKDNSWNILMQYKKENPDKIRVYTQPNRGISATRNRGIELASGDYISFIDNDDYIATDYIERIMRKAVGTNADMIQVGHTRVTPNGTILAKKACTKDMTILSTDKEKYITYVSGYVWGGAFKRSMFEKVLFPVGFFYEDIITRLVMMRIATHIEIIGESLYFYLVHDKNASKTVWKSNFWKVIDQLYLSKAFTEYTHKILGLPNDDILYEVLCTELGRTLWLRTRKLPLKYQKAIFAISSDYMKQIRPEKILRTEQSLNYSKIFAHRNFYAWWLYCLSQMAEVKIRNGTN